MIRKLTLAALAAVTLITMRPTPAGASSPTPSSGTKEPYAGQSLCLPALHLEPSPDCLPLGPSQIINDMAKKGIIYPFPPLPISQPSADLNNVEYKYAKVNVPPPERAPVYATLDDALNGNTPTQYLQPGRLLYVSYKQLSDVNGGHYLYLKTNVWMRASPTTYARFQGLQLKQQVYNSFGWIVEQCKARSAPGYANPEVGDLLVGQSVTPIFEKQTADGTDWYLIGLNKWVERRYIRQTVFSTAPPKGVTGNRWIEVNLYEQTLTIYDQGNPVFVTLIASGIEPFYTQPGIFQIYKKKPAETMSGAFEADASDYYYLEDVPWTMYFDKLRALHGAYWRTMFGYPQSHGCVNLSVGDARLLYDWAVEGDWVYVHDPSGQTPTDPKMYSDGGA